MCKCVLCSVVHCLSGMCKFFLSRITSALWDWLLPGPAGTGGTGFLLSWLKEKEKNDEQVTVVSLSKQMAELAAEKNRNGYDTR